MVDLGKNIFLTPLIKAQFTRTILLMRSSIKLIKTGEKKKEKISSTVQESQNVVIVWLIRMKIWKKKSVEGNRSF